MKRFFKHPRILVASLLVAFCAISCGGRRTTAKEAFQPRKFPPMPSVPAMITDEAEAREYVAMHFWDAFLDTSKTYPCDTGQVNGVRKADVESALGMFLTILENSLSVSSGQKAVSELFKKVSAMETADTSSNAFEFFEEQVPRYLYDPNSPVRNEDLYLPYVSGLASSPLVDEDMVPAYSHDAGMCSLNRYGTPAADFTFTDLAGHRHTLHGIKAEYTLLFFSNPGCHACGEILEALTNSQKVMALISSGKMAVVNMYIDLERDKWREYAKTYPKEWYNGFDQDYVIRTDVTYNVRAIPSVYLLDSGKNVILKDATAGNLMTYLEQL